MRFRLFFGELRLRLVDQSEEVAHTEDAGSEAVRVKRLEGVRLLTGADELDGHAGNGSDGERCATARVAVEFREDEAGERHGLVELLGGVDGLLPGHGVRHQKHLSR